MRRVGAILLGSVCAFVLAGPALAQDYPPEILGEVAVSDSTVVCGAQSIVVSGNGWLPGETVTIHFRSNQIGSATPDAQGNFEVTVDIPDAPLGEHEIIAVQETDAEEPRIEGVATITCVAGVSLAVTGANISVWVAIVAGLFVVGGAALFAGRRRRVETQ